MRSFCSTQSMEQPVQYAPFHLLHVLDPHHGSTNNEYIYSIVSDNEESRIAITSSSPNIKLYALNSTMAFQDNLKGHSDQVHSIVFHSTNTLVSCSEDCHVCLFDVRRSNKVLQRENMNIGALYSLDLQLTNNNILAVSGETTFQLRDLRKMNQILYNFEDIHTMTIRKLKFYPNNRLFSSSDDGLVHIYDLNVLGTVEDAEDCLCGVINAENGVHQFALCSQLGNVLYTVNHMHELAFWSMENMTQIGASLTRQALERIYPTTNYQQASLNQMDVETSENYLIDASYFVQTDSMFAFVGTPSSTVIVCKVILQNNQATYVPMAQMSKGHVESTVIRCIWASRSGQFDRVITGGEDGRICIWSATETASKSTSPVFEKLRGNHNQKQQQMNPYSRGAGPARGSKAIRDRASRNQ
jgi:WD40 repeat protein